MPTNTPARSFLQRTARAGVAVLASGSLFQTCETRVRDAFVDGTRAYILTLLDPSNVVELFPGLEGMDDGP